MSLGHPISVVVLAKNEASILGTCLASLRWADEVVVVDDQSTDNTVAVAEQFGARIVQHSFESFATQRNWALANAELQNEWVLMLDADEASTPAFAQQVQRSAARATSQTVAFRTCRKTMFAGRWLRYSDGFPVWIMRVVRNGFVQFTDQGHGEVPVPKVNGTIGVIPEAFIHAPFSRGLGDWWGRHIRYAEREAWLECQKEANLNWRQLVSQDASQRRAAVRSLSRRLPFRSGARFFYQYIIKRGFLDGTAGLQFCRMMACYEQMIVTKKWERLRTQTRIATPATQTVAMRKERPSAKWPTATR
ncbi:glycosyltransferase family 2 protein [Roseiconus lacunae]|uniref:Glycosyltransferase family 2 protein n=1 Tax=Roseiconus lacunae TaxID=2605694 RepID=A0ABT7PPQ0_9BACT|nr:glycosyltransferase family 2 protein [Roseiconus lacunae]MCD0462995.1 glycosyltransferase family 2 protein [Roseiconus lacunae]MDM4018474.1 glycosyltransferase family 2 protein [Roseiconus lacunae]